MRWWDEEEECFDQSDIFDPLRVERSRPVEDDEANLVESICQSATPGPLVIDDQASGEGAVVATLPDGRHIVSLRTLDGSPEQAEMAATANAQLICEARHMMLRLLRDRDHWHRREQRLLERIRSLEAELEQYGIAVPQGGHTSKERLPAQPR